MDNYGDRIKKYRRREQMTTWVVAGGAALIAFVGARALEGAPRVLTALIFTGAVMAGLTAALARVGFEWRATLLERKVAAESVSEATALEAVDNPWPSGPERNWDACLTVIVLSWVIMLTGVWWPRTPAQVTERPGSDHRELLTLPIGGVRPFTDCDADLSTGQKDQLDLLVKTYRDRAANASTALIILVGVADNRRLTPHCALRFATNEQLAVTRANRVRAQLEQRLSDDRLKPGYIVITSGPRHLEANAEGEDRRQDRAVDAWVAIDQQIGASLR